MEGGERGGEEVEGGGGVTEGRGRVGVRGGEESESDEGEEEGEEEVLMSMSHGGEGGRVTADGRSVGGEGGGGATSRVMGERVRMV